MSTYRRAAFMQRKASKAGKQHHHLYLLTKTDRIRMVIGFFIIAAFFVSIRLFMIQVLDHGFYAALASDQHALVEQLSPQRGEIYVKDKFSETGIALIATNRTMYHVYANPKQIPHDDVEHTIQAITPILGMDPETLRERLTKENDVYEPLKHKVSNEEIASLKDVIAKERLAGLHWTEEDVRYYPEGPTVSSFTGFVGMVNDHPKGQYGLEEYFEKELAGVPGSLSTELDAAGRFIAVGEKSVVEAQDGDTLILTIDKNIQHRACTLLEQAVANHGAKQGSMIVMNPRTGAILALCNAPMYDPNHYADVENIQQFMNDAVADQYEPGSVFKPFTMATAIQEGKVTPYSTYQDNGSVQIGKYTIRNSDGKSHGVVDMRTVLEFSLNTGAIYVVQQVGNEVWDRSVQAFGFGKETGITLGGENPGDIDALHQHKDIYSATSSYGQGITVTPLQLIQGYATFANNGVMMKPYIVDRVVKANGFEEEKKPEVLGQPISAETAQTIGAMLVRVIDEGHARRAGIPGYFIAGKTGTAQVPREDGLGYDTRRHKDTFVGFGPVSDPQFIVLAKIDEPQDVQWADGSAAPLVGELGKFLVQYLQIPPDRK